MSLLTQKIFALLNWMFMTMRWFLVKKITSNSVLMMFAIISSRFDSLHLCALQREKIWLTTVLPLVKDNFDLTAQELHDALAVKYVQKTPA